MKLPSSERIRKLTPYLAPAAVVFLCVVVYLVGKAFAAPPPPRSVRIATGGVGGAYHDFGRRLAARMGELGIEVEVVPTRGSIDNYRRLAAPGVPDEDPETRVDLAFVQGGTREAALGPDVDPETSPVRSIAECYSEPIWLFYRAERGMDGTAIEIDQLTDLVGKRINVGPVGSGTEPVARLLLAKNGIEHGTDDTRLSTLDNTAAVQRLEADDLDAIFLIAGPTSSHVRRLLSDRDTGILLMDFRRHVAYSRQIPYLSQVVLAEGVVDLLANFPPRDMNLLAPQAILACRADLNPRIVELVYRVSTEIFTPGSAVDPPGRFPRLDRTELVAHRAAESYVDHGESWWSRNLPFWAVRWLSEFKLLLLPLLTVLLPAFKLVPLAIKMRIRLLLARHYKALREVDSELEEADSVEQIESTLDKVESLRDELSRLSRKFSGHYQSDLYHWRLHLQLVRNEIRERIVRAKRATRQMRTPSAEREETRRQARLESGAEE